MPVTLVQGMLYAFVALGVMIPFRLLAFPDLTSEGQLPAGRLPVRGADGGRR